jgi:hypothetical protein
MSGQLATGGAVVQLVAQGLGDAVLTGNPQVTFWRFVAKAYTNFALETQLLDFTAGQPNFGAFPKCNLDRIGDLVYWMYFVVDLPGIGLVYKPRNTSTATNSTGAEILSNPAPDGSLWEPYWTRAIGQALIESVNFFIGGQNIDYMKGEFLYIWEELTGQPGKRLVEMTGNYRALESLMVASRQPRRLYVPLPFWFTMNSGLSLPIVSLQFHSVSVSIKIRPLQSLIRLTKAALSNTGPAANQGASQTGYTLNDVYVRPFFDSDYYAGSQSIQPVSDLTQIIQSNNLNGYIEVCYVYLDQRERSKFADGAFEQLIVEHQETSTQVDNQVTTKWGYASQSKKINFELNFNHTIIELFWVARLGIRGAWNGTNTNPVNALFNDWFNFSGPQDVVTELPIDPVLRIQLRLNNSVRFGESEGRYFRLVQPWQHHTNIPRDMIYTYSFALQPEDVQPSGSCNFSRIDNTQLNVTFDRRLWYGPSDDGGNDNNSSVTFLVYATNWNILRFKFGLGGKHSGFFMLMLAAALLLLQKKRVSAPVLCTPGAGVPAAAIMVAAAA